MITKSGSIIQQQGAALVVALIMLVLMTLIGMTAMQVTTIQSKLVSNTSDSDKAFQAAETALKRGEDYTLLCDFSKIKEREYPFTDSCTDGLCKPTPISSDPQWLEAVGENKIWEDTSTKTLKYGSETKPAGDASKNISSVSPLPASSVAKQPRFMIERISDIDSLQKDINKGWFRVTAQGYGQRMGDDGEPSSRVMLQSLIPKE